MTEKIAIVTGSARGIGAATARRLATDGMAVAVLDLDEAACAGTVKEIADAGGRALAVGADVSDGAQVLAAVERVAAETWGLDPDWISVEVPATDLAAVAHPFAPGRAITGSARAAALAPGVRTRHQRRVVAAGAAIGT